MAGQGRRLQSTPCMHAWQELALWPGAELVSPALCCRTVQRQTVHAQLQHLPPVLLLSKPGPANEAVQHTLTLRLRQPYTGRVNPQAQAGSARCDDTVVVNALILLCSGCPSAVQRHALVKTNTCTCTQTWVRCCCGFFYTHLASCAAAPPAGVRSEPHST